MKCAYCQSEIPEGLEYCPFCGEVLEEVPEPAEAEQQEESVLKKILVEAKEEPDEDVKDPSPTAAKESVTRGHGDPSFEEKGSEKSLEQILAQKVANGEMSVEHMVSMLAVINKPQEEPEETEEPVRRRLRRREKSEQEKAAEQLAADEFYQNTRPLVDDPLPPSPWIKIVKIILVVILIVIIVLGAIYYL